MGGGVFGRDSVCTNTLNASYTPGRSSGSSRAVRACCRGRASRCEQQCCRGACPVAFVHGRRWAVCSRTQPTSTAAAFPSLRSRRQGGAETVEVAVETRVRACLGHEVAVVVEDQSPPVDVEYASPWERDPDVDPCVGLAAVEIEESAPGTSGVDRKTVGGEDTGEVLLHLHADWGAGAVEEDLEMPFRRVRLRDRETAGSAHTGVDIRVGAMERADDRLFYGSSKRGPRHRRQHRNGAEKSEGD